MAQFRMNRRAVIRGAGTIAIALPWMEAMGPSRYARAAGTPGKRFVTVYTPGGSVFGKWQPTGTEAAPVLSPILSPLEPMKSKIVVVDGLEMKSARGEQHQSGIVAWLSGTGQAGTDQRGYAQGPSVDQVIASKISADKRKQSLQIAVRWATGKSFGKLSPINSVNFENNAKFSPIPPRLDPKAIWTELFGSLGSVPGMTTDLVAARKKSILDFVDKKYASLALRLGTADRAKLDQHLTKLREIEKSITVTTPTSATCKAPVLIDTSDYNPTTGLNSASDGSKVDGSTDAAIPKVGQLMMDMIVMALACDITGVASFQWSDTEAKHTFPWLNLKNHHHFYQHDGGFKPVECEAIAKWYSQQHLYLLQQMQAVDMGGHSLLDESVVFFGSELSEPPTHKKLNMPFLLAGGGGGLRTGRWVKYTGNISHNNLLVSILNMFGDTRTTFGDPMYCTGALPNLVA